MYQSMKEKMNKAVATVAVLAMSTGVAHAAIDVSDAVSEIESGKGAVALVGGAILVVLGVVAAFKYVRAGLR